MFGHRGSYHQTHIDGRRAAVFWPQSQPNDTALQRPRPLLPSDYGFFPSPSHLRIFAIRLPMRQLYAHDTGSRIVPFSSPRNRLLLGDLRDGSGYDRSDA